MKTMWPPSYHQYDLGALCAVVHHVPKSMSCYKTIAVIIGRAHCFHDFHYNIFLFPYKQVNKTSCFRKVKIRHSDKRNDNFCNHFHSILRLFDVLPNFPFTTSEAMCTIITYEHGIYELPHELPNNLRLRVLGN